MLKTTFKNFLLEKLELLDSSDITDILKTKAWDQVFQKTKQIVSGNEPPRTGDLNILTNSVYEVLTQVPEMEEALVKLYGHDLASSSDYKDHNNQYKSLISKIENYVNQSKSWKTENTGAWCHFVKSGQRSDSTKTFKWYGTLKVREIDSIKIVSNVIYEVAKIKTDAEIQIKIPANYGAFIKHIDSIVIHYHDESLKSEIEAIARKFQSYLADRTKLMRTDFGTDDKAYGDKGSDSMIIAKKFSDTIVKNFELIKKYFNEKDEKDVNQILLSIVNKIMLNSTHR